jgi:hypothetical protein
VSPLVALLYASLLAAPPLPAPVGAASAPAPAPETREELRRDEVRLLHQVLRPIDLASNLRIFDARTGEWLRTATSDPPASHVVVLYLWNPAAPEAQAELPWLREMARRVEIYHGGDVRFLFIAESVAAPDMKAFVAGLHDRAPGMPFFLDQEGSITDALRQALPGSRLPLPMTLILDDQRAVRQALVGSVASRRSEIVSAISDLLYQIRVARGHHQ